MPLATIPPLFGTGAGECVLHGMTAECRLPGCAVIASCSCGMCSRALSVSGFRQELPSDSEDVSTDEEERSATERDIQLRAVTRHYRRLKQGTLFPVTGTDFTLLAGVFMIWS